MTNANVVQDPNRMEAYVRLFKKDDPTFEFDQLDKVRRWRAYVASYMAVEPTENVEFNKLRHPYLAKRLAKLEDVNEDDRFDLVKSEDKITVSILPQNYTMKFIASEPFGTGGVQYFLQPDEIRAGVGSKEDYAALVEAKKERVQELFVRNNEWMKDLSRDDVDEKKAAFRKALEEAKRVDDVEMTDA